MSAAPDHPEPVEPAPAVRAPWPDMYRLVTDFRHARRQKKHYLLNPDDTIAWAGNTIAQAIAWLAHRDHWAVHWINGADHRIVTFVKPGSELARELRAVWDALEPQRSKTDG